MTTDNALMREVRLKPGPSGCFIPTQRLLRHVGKQSSLCACRSKHPRGLIYAWRKSKLNRSLCSTQHNALKHPRAVLRRRDGVIAVADAAVVAGTVGGVQEAHQAPHLPHVVMYRGTRHGEPKARREFPCHVGDYGITPLQNMRLIHHGHNPCPFSEKPAVLIENSGGCHKDAVAIAPSGAQ
ncbi:uncharacterized protein Tco025E_00074 [Trypanosoma conorhini]|uniref:Uncharacterized protein n=1 Tax=Trypanosoma conorhini TaxID=83891 RepID=A0A3R7Q062_9TRYP|nr:uncharacterized protein Tco025E_00074 [Trypanosoma conorhini]RNF27690.1 hypothetical protein Tco025E_00074 [Trypanosoma conorhini]